MFPTRVLWGIQSSRSISSDFFVARSRSLFFMGPKVCSCWVVLPVKLTSVFMEILPVLGSRIKGDPLTVMAGVIFMCSDCIWI